MILLIHIEFWNNCYWLLHVSPQRDSGIFSRIRNLFLRKDQDRGVACSSNLVYPRGLNERRWTPDDVILDPISGLPSATSYPASCPVDPKFLMNWRTHSFITSRSAMHEWILRFCITSKYEKISLCLRVWFNILSLMYIIISFILYDSCLLCEERKIFIN